MKATIIILGIVVLVVITVLTTVFFKPEPEVNPQAGTIDAVSVLSATDTAGYAHVTAPREFVFPQDHGPHPEFKTEWWYFTGNLVSESGRRFGFQLTFFRSALSSDSVQSTSNWATKQMYMGHFALSDIANNRFYSFEQFARGAADLAGVETQPFRVWLYDWQVHSTKSAMFPLRLVAKDSTASIDIMLDSLKPLVLQGDKGLSQKGRGEGNASYYYSYTRMAAEGIIEIGGERYTVEGAAWLDREWGTSALEQNQEGWDWFALQLANGSELMYFRLRTTGGGVDAMSAGVLVAPDGSSTPLKADDVQLDVQKQWKSPWSEASYPAKWRLRVPKQNIDLVAEPFMNDQELQVSVRYWEGAVGVQGTWQESKVTGHGYVEMTGYGRKKAAAVR